MEGYCLWDGCDSPSLFTLHTNWLTHAGLKGPQQRTDWSISVWSLPPSVLTLGFSKANQFVRIFRQTDFSQISYVLVSVTTLVICIFNQAMLYLMNTFERNCIINVHLDLLRLHWKKSNRIRWLFQQSGVIWCHSCCPWGPLRAPQAPCLAPVSGIVCTS